MSLKRPQNSAEKKTDKKAEEQARDERVLTECRKNQREYH